jgi:phosphoglycerate dehydrogenase-like enzyme
MHPTPVPASPTASSSDDARPLSILLSRRAVGEVGPAIAACLGARAHRLVVAGEGESVAQADQVDVAFVSRDVTGTSTKDAPTDALRAFHGLLRAASRLRWVHAHSAGADRPIYGELRARGVAVSTSSGANAEIVAQAALAGVLALSRRFPQMIAAQHRRDWAPLSRGAPPPDLVGQTAVLVGWGPVGQRLGAMLRMLGLRLVVVRHSAGPAGEGIETLTYDALPAVLPRADWLVLACPLSERTRRLVDAAALAALPAGAHLVNVARGEVVEEVALAEALAAGRLAGAHLDVFEHEPLSGDSPFWAMPNVIVTAHSAGYAAGNAARVAQCFVDNLGRFITGQPLHNAVA